MFTYKCKVDRVVDGDTVDLIIDLGFSTFVKKRIRLLGVDTPETRTRDKKEKVAGLAAKEFTKDYLEGAKGLTIQTFKDRAGKFGRILGEISADGKLSLNRELLRQGLAIEYFGGKRKRKGKRK